MPAKLKLVNFAGMPGVKTGKSNVAGHFCSHIGTVSQVVLAAMSQVHQQQMRTMRLYCIKVVQLLVDVI